MCANCPKSFAARRQIFPFANIRRATTTYVRIQLMIRPRWMFPSPRRLLTSLNLLRIIWIFLFFTLEHKIYHDAIKSCPWPFAGPQECRMAIIGDPQIVDENTYSRRGIGMWLTKIFTDRYMRRNWKHLMRQNPGTVIFVGDLMDGGREWEDNK
jgi:hypothetical protein